MKKFYISSFCFLLHFRFFSFVIPLSIPSSLSFTPNDNKHTIPALPVNYTIPSTESNRPLVPLTNGRPSPISIAAPDPFYAQVPGATQTIKFHNYGHNIDRTSAVLVLRQAKDDALFEHHRAGQPMGEQRIIYRDGIRYREALELVFSPGSVMTWDLWYECVIGIEDFYQDFEYTELKFDVLIGGSKGYAVMGNGSIVAATL